MRYRKRILAGLLSLVMTAGSLMPAIQVEALDSWGTFWPNLTYNGSEQRYGVSGFQANGTSYRVDTEGINIVDFETGAEHLNLTPEN